MHGFNNFFCNGKIDRPAGSILIVDPSLSPTSPSAIRLNNSGFKVEVVPDAGKALKRLAEHKYDLIISETKLPDTDGMMVRMATSEMPKDLPYLSRISTKTFLLSGDTIEGHVYTDLPKTHTRLSDLLNFSQKFIFIDVDEQDFLINTNFVKMVMPG